MKSFIFMFAVGGAFIGALHLGLLQPPGVVRRQLRAKLAAHGCQVHGEIRWEDGWRFTDVTVTRAGLEARVERLDVPMRWGAWLNKRLGVVRVEGVTVELDAAALRRLRRRLRAKAEAPEAGPAGDGWLDAVDVRGARLLIKTPWGEAMAPTFTLKREGGWRGAAPLIAIAPEGGGELLHARASLEGGKALLEGQGDTPAFRCGDGEIERALRALEVDLNAKQITLRGARLRDADVDADLGALTLPLARGPLQIRGGRVALRAWPPKLGPICPGLGAPAEALAGPGGGGAGLRRRLLRRGLSIRGVYVETPRGGIEITRARVNPEGIDLQARAWGGEIKATAAGLGPDLRPKAASIEAKGIDLAQAPRTPFKLGGQARLKAQADLEAGCVDLEVSVAGGALTHPSIADEPLTGIDGGARGALCWREGEISLKEAEAWLARIHVKLEATLSRLGSRPHLKLKAHMDKISCQGALDAAPRALLGPYKGIELKGHIAPNLWLDYPLEDPAKLDFKISGLRRRCEVTALNAPPEAQPPLRNPVPGLDDVAWLNEPFVFDVREGVDEAVAVGPGTSSYAPIDTLPSYVGGAAYLSEEMGFYKGWALSWPLIKKGLRLSLAKGKFVYGGSTVTQQLVKNLFLTRDKTLARKLREALIASRVQDVVTRDRILELYLNCIEYGANVYGIEAAAWHYFQKPASVLKAKEAIFLAMLKPAPYQGRWFLKRGHTPDYPWWNQRVEELFMRLIKAGMLTEEEAEAERPYQLHWDEGRYRDE